MQPNSKSDVEDNDFPTKEAAALVLPVQTSDGWPYGCSSTLGDTVAKGWMSILSCPQCDSVTQLR